MTIQIIRFTFLSVALVLTGCAGSLSKSDCEKLDFYEAGLKEGKAGRDNARLVVIRESCGSHGVKVDEEKYNFGRNVGLAQHCDEDRAETDVKKGVTDSICIQEKVPPYLTSYRAAVDGNRQNKMKALKKVQETREELEKEERQLQSELKVLEQQGTIVVQ